MRLIRCDRCRKEIQPVLTDNRIGYVALNIRDLNTDDLIDGNPFEHADFCPGCMKEIEAFIRKAPTQQDPEMSETELINSSKGGQSGPAAGKAKKRPAIDKGKIGALWDGQWSVKAIAEEMKCSDERVRQVLKELGKYPTKEEE